MRKLFTVWNTSIRPSALTRSKILLSAMNVPVRPAPALQREKKTFRNKRYSTLRHMLFNIRSRYLQCTTMGWFPDCCCCFCTEAMMSIMPFPSAGMPTSGHPWKWKCLIVLVCFSCEKKCPDKWNYDTNGGSFISSPRKGGELSVLDLCDWW